MFSSFTGSFSFGRRRVSLPAQAATIADYRSILSPTGQTAYDAANEGDFFFVSAADYASVFTSITGAFKIGMADNQLVDDPQSTFSRNFATTLPQANATVPSGTLLFGFISEHASGSNNHQPRIATTYKASASSYTAIANAPLVSSTNGLSHHLRKPPFNATASESFIALFPISFGTGGTGSFRTHGGATTWTGGGYSQGGGWTAWNATLPKFQMAGVAE